jgi:hypothetical protein
MFSTAARNARLVSPTPNAYPAVNVNEGTMNKSAQAAMLMLQKYHRALALASPSAFSCVRLDGRKRPSDRRHP